MDTYDLIKRSEEFNKILENLKKSIYKIKPSGINFGNPGDKDEFFEDDKTIAKTLIQVNSGRYPDDYIDKELIGKFYVNDEDASFIVDNMPEDHPLLKDIIKQKKEQIKDALQEFKIKAKELFDAIMNALTVQLPNAITTIAISPTIMLPGSGIPSALTAIQSLITAIKEIISKILEFIPLLTILTSMIYYIKQKNAMSIIISTLGLIGKPLELIGGLTKSIDDVDSQANNMKPPEPEPPEPPEPTDENPTTPTPTPTDESGIGLPEGEPSTGTPHTEPVINMYITPAKPDINKKTTFTDTSINITQYIRVIWSLRNDKKDEIKKWTSSDLGLNNVKSVSYYFKLPGTYSMTLYVTHLYNNKQVTDERTFTFNVGNVVL